MTTNGDRVSVWGDQKVPELHSGDSGTKLRMYVMPLNGALKNGSNGKRSVTCILTQ